MLRRADEQPDEDRQIQKSQQVADGSEDPILTSTQLIEYAIRIRETSPYPVMDVVRENQQRAEQEEHEQQEEVAAAQKAVEAGVYQCKAPPGNRDGT